MARDVKGGAVFRWGFYGVLTYYTNIFTPFRTGWKSGDLGLRWPAALGPVKVFSRASGSDLNINKCELMAIKECSSGSISNIHVKNEVRYLGVIMTKNQQRRTCLNLDAIIQKTQSRLNQCLRRDLSLRGRVLIT